MAGISNYAENKMIDLALRNVAWTMPTVYMGLYTVTPDDTGGGTEVIGNGYGRQAITFGAAASRAAANSVKVTFPVATPATWGPIVANGIFDAPTAGNLLWWGPLSTARTVGVGKQIEFAIGEVDITFPANKIATYLANKLLDHSLGVASYTPAATVYAALFTTATTDAGGGTEVSGNAYVRTAVTFSAASGGATSNSADVSFPAATPAGWGTVTHGACMDASTAGNMLFHGALVGSVVVNAEEIFKFPVGDFDVSQD